MRRTSIPLLLAVALGVALVAPLTAGGAKPKRIHFKFSTTATGAQISSTEAAYKVKDSRFGRGAGVQKVKLDKTGLAGTDAEVSYYRHGSADSHGTFKIGTPDADGIAPLTGKGHDTGGTGVARGFKSSYTITGTFDTKHSTYTVKLKGRGSLPAPKKH